jgi:hypothetical protein
MSERYRGSIAEVSQSAGEGFYARMQLMLCEWATPQWRVCRS